MSIYVGINAEDLSLSYDFLNLFFNYVIEITMRENPDFDKTLTHTCLMLMDEFPAIGRMESIKRFGVYRRFQSEIADHLSEYQPATRDLRTGRSQNTDEWTPLSYHLCCFRAG